MKKLLFLFVLGLSLIISRSCFAQDDSSRNYNEDEMQSPDTAMGSCSMCRQKIAIGVEAGVNIANYTYGTNGSGKLVSSDPIVRGRAGVIIDIPVHGIFYIQPGAFYAMNGAASIAGGGTWNVNTIEVPVNLELKFGCCGPVRFFVGAGPYVGYNFSGNITGTSDNGSLKIGSSSNDALMAFDFGADVNGGIELNNGLLFRLRFQEGLINLEPHSGYSSINNMSYGAQVGYLFGRCAKCIRKEKSHHEREERVWDQ